MKMDSTKHARIVKLAEKIAEGANFAKALRVGATKADREDWRTDFARTAANVEDDVCRLCERMQRLCLGGIPAAED